MQHASEITSNQIEVHEDLSKYVRRHQSITSKKPLSEHTQRAFELVISWLGDWKQDVIVDACCGVGESTVVLARRYPEAKVIGIDKSAARLDKHAHYQSRYVAEPLQNALVVRADLYDFWRLLENKLSQGTDWQVVKQFLFYPNPYPKKSQLSKRWHASAAFPSMLGVSKNIELRSNWSIYVREFALAAAEYGVTMCIEQHKGQAITPFERKYLSSQQTCWRAYTVV
ncbi:tRNA (guanine(46)-N(7))-methyltransferase TrmB [Agaribacter flavus]|uniref:tRNA (guanine(46)-N(7))-methyltransferase n=1 Tax=Agaribacter flavus TaxID=1902781 RepID=A0ABV7FUL4_9ALTE